MPKALKYIIAIAALLVLTLAGLTSYILFGMDPNSFKPQLEQAASDQGVELEIRGELGWSLFPKLALRLGETHFVSAQHNIPPSSLGSAELVLDFWALLSRRVAVNALVLKDADLHFSSAGQAAAAMAAPVAEGKATATGPGGESLALAIARVAISNSTFTLQGAEGNQVFSNINLDARDLTADGERFPVELAFSYLPADGETALDIAASLQLGFASETQTLALEAVDVEVNNLLPQPLHLHGAGTLDLGASSISLPSVRATLAGLRLEGALTVAHFADAPQASGNLQLSSSTLRADLQALTGDEVVTASPEALKTLNLATQFAATGDLLSLDGLAIALDDTTLKGNVRLRLADPRTLTLALEGDHINLDDYLAPKSNAQTPEGKESAATAGEEALFAPLAGLLALLDGGRGTVNLTLDSLILADTTISPLRLTAAISGSKLSISPLQLGIYGGDIEAAVALDLGAPEPRLSFSQRGTKLDLETAQRAWVDDVNLTGTLAMVVEGSTRGATKDALLANLAATGNLDIDNLHLASVNVEQSYCELAALVEKPPAREQPWAVGTDLNRFTSVFRIQGQTLELTDYNTGVGNLKVRGDGTILLADQSFAIRVITRLEGDRTSATGCAVKSKRVRDKDIPLLCKDTFADAGARSCKPDPDFVEDLLKDEVLDKIKDRIGDDKVQEVEGLLRGIFNR